MPPETTSLVDNDIMSDGDEDDSKDIINSPKFGIRTTKCVNNSKQLCNGVPNAQDFTCALFNTLVTFTKIIYDF